ncbi:MAG TPA: hypothetical protein VF721_10955 [Pyrinomonadaceae bacterium]|jgi:hypothetical protein
MIDDEREKLERDLKNYRRWFFIALPFALLGGFFVCVVGAAIVKEFVFNQKVSLSGDVDTIAEFAEKMPAPEKIVVAERNGCRYFFVYGSTRVLLASGAPVYVFDSQGNLIIWSGDTGDAGENHPWWKYFSKSTSIKTVSLQEAVETAAKNNQ